jgi:hypothetical protein
MFVRYRYRTQPAYLGHPSKLWLILWLRAMYRNTYRLTLEMDPPSASSAAQDAYWLMLGDLMLDPARTSNVRREASNTRAQQEHERLSEQVGETLDKYSNPAGGDVLTRVFGYGHHSSRTHATHGAEARPPEHANNGRERRRKTQSARNRHSSR